MKRSEKKYADSLISNYFDSLTGRPEVQQMKTDIWPDTKKAGYKVEPLTCIQYIPIHNKNNWEISSP